MKPALKRASYNKAMAHSARMDKDVVAKYRKQLGDKNLEPIEQFRAQCLSRGCTGIQGIGRSGFESIIAGR